MSLPVTITFGGLIAADDDLYVVSATPVSGTAMTLTGSSADVARRVLVTYGNEASDRTMRITGTNADGNPIQETVAIPNGGSGTVATVQDFKTLTQVMPLGGGWTAAAKVGTNTVASSPWKLSNGIYNPSESIAWDTSVTGTINYDLEYTMGDPNNNQNTPGGANGNYPATVTAIDVTNMAGKTGAAQGSMSTPFYAWRVTINSGTGTVVVRGIEAGIAGRRG